MGKQLSGESMPSALDMFLTGLATGEVDEVDVSFAEGCWLTPRYRVLGELGAGGMGIVLRCWDEWRQGEVALKLLRPWLTDGSLDQLRQELRLQERCLHEGIVRSFDLGRIGDESGSGSGVWFLTMELVEGRSLRRVLEESRIGGALPLLPWSSCASWLGSLVDVLSYAHERGVVHRDLKPSNLLLTDDGSVKLLDFGIAAMREGVPGSEGSSGAGIAGTAYYMAPEQLVGGAITPAADVYALAALIYEILTGRLVSGCIEGPWAFLSHEGLEPAFGEAVDGVFLRALSQRPKARYQDVSTFWSALCEAMATEVEAGISTVVGRVESGLAVELSLDGGQWELETELGRYAFDTIAEEGEIATVWKGDIVSGDEAGLAVVAKIVELPEDNDLMCDEIRALRLLCAGASKQRKHLPTLLDQFTTSEGQQGVILAYFDGCDLEAVKEAYPDGIPQVHAFWIMRRALSVLGYAHSLGILHGNVEPTHIMLRPSDHNLLLLDWSYAVIHPAQTGQGFKCWNELYSPPEVREQKPPVPSSDLYSLGKVMIELLGGDLETGALPGSVDARLARLLQYMTRHSALQRPRDAWALYHQVNQLRKTVLGKHEFIAFSMP